MTIPVLKDDATVKADVFYVYCAVIGADRKRLAAKTGSNRPILFCFNGAGRASSALHTNEVAAWTQDAAISSKIYICKNSQG